MRRRAALAAAAALHAGCADGADGRPAAPAPEEHDVRALIARMLDVHPGLRPGTPVGAALREKGEALAEQVARGDTRLAVEPDVPVALTAADFFAGRDPVLQAALR